MQAVEVLEDLGNSISQQLALPENESSVTFQEVKEDLGEEIILHLAVYHLAWTINTEEYGSIYALEAVEC